MEIVNKYYTGILIFITAIQIFSSQFIRYRLFKVIWIHRKQLLRRELNAYIHREEEVSGKGILFVYLSAGTIGSHNTVG